MHKTVGERFMSPAQRALEATIIEVIRTVYDPEIPVNIYELGLIYEIGIDAENRVKVKMTLTAPAARWPDRCRLRSNERSKRFPR